MKPNHITRERIITTLVTSLQPLSYIYALWEAGAASFNRIDQWSDIDLYLVVDDEAIAETFKSMEEAFSNLSGLELEFRLPAPTWHGHSQAFYRLKNASPFLFLDIVVMKESSKDKFLQFQIHEEPIVYFDKKSLVKNDLIQPEAFLDKLEARLQMLRVTFDLFQVLTLKEINRGNDIEALSYYMTYTYKPLVEVLRIKYSPYHYNFHNSYIYYDLPDQIVKRLHGLNFIPDSKALSRCRDEAEAWFWKVIDSIGREHIERILHPDS